MSTTSAPGAPVRPQVGALLRSGPQRREIKRLLEAVLYLSPALIIFATFVFIPLLRSIRLSTFLTNPIGWSGAFVGLTVPFLAPAFGTFLLCQSGTHLHTFDCRQSPVDPRPDSRRGQGLIMACHEAPNVAKRRVPIRAIRGQISTLS